MLADTAAYLCYDQAVALFTSMSEEQLKAFLDTVKSDTSLQEKLNAAKSPQEVVDVAKQSGYELSFEQLH